MAIWGADIQQLRQLSSQLNQKAGEIDSVLSTLTSQLGNTDWRGPDSEAFRNDWQSTHTNALKQVASALRDAASKAQQNANQQESTSAN